MGRGRVAVGSRCQCGFRHPCSVAVSHRLPTPVRKALSRTNAVRRVGPCASYPGVAIQLALTENA